MSFLRIWGTEFEKLADLRIFEYQGFYYLFIWFEFQSNSNLIWLDFQNFLPAALIGIKVRYLSIIKAKLGIFSIHGAKIQIFAMKARSIPSSSGYSRSWPIKKNFPKTCIRSSRRIYRFKNFSIWDTRPALGVGKKNFKFFYQKFKNCPFTTLNCCTLLDCYNLQHSWN